jgi:nucleotide-binding universal stress UspA family protein
VDYLAERRRESNVTYKNILVHADDERRTTVRVGIAAQVAARSGSQISVVYAPRAAGRVLGLQAHMVAAADRGDDANDTLGDLDLARRVAGAAGVPCEWIAITDDPVASLVARGRCADLVILGQRDPHAQDDPAFVDLPAEVILGVGRPVVVVPHSHSMQSLGEHIVIAWSGTRESARAVADALPLLIRAKSVCILSGAEHKAKRITTAAAALIKSLERHGVKAALSDLGRHRFDVGERIISFCTDHHADLLVMGAYGHSRAQELVLGGVTQTVLGAMTLPVLMSH